MRQERPILFSTDMVLALFAGKKTQTRRTIKKKYENTEICWKDDKYGRRLIERQNDAPEPVVVDHGDGKTTTTRSLVAFREIPKPFKVGDLLWVREEHYAFGWWIEKEGEYKLSRKPKEKFIHTADRAMSTIYFSDTRPDSLRVERTRTSHPAWYKRIGRFMPKAYARIWLQVTDIRAQRVQDISEADAVAEGCEGLGDWAFKPSEAFEDVWKNINGDDSWKSNPWVWAVTFKVLSTTGKPGKI